MDTNVLYYGDNLDILRRGYILEESVDLVYLDRAVGNGPTSIGLSGLLRAGKNIATPLPSPAALLD